MGHAGGELSRRRQALGLPQARVEPLTVAAGPLEHHDDHGEGREEVQQDEHGVHREVAGRARNHAHELRRDAVNAPEREESGQEPFAAKAGHSALERPEQEAGGHLDDAERDADGALSFFTAHVAGQGQADRDSGPDQNVSRPEPIAPAMREGGRQGEADRGHGRQVGDEARMIDAQHEHVHELETLRQRVRTPRQEQVLEEANPV